MTGDRTGGPRQLFVPRPASRSRDRRIGGEAVGFALFFPTSRRSSPSPACASRICSCGVRGQGRGEALLAHLARIGAGARLRPARVDGARLERARDRFYASRRRAEAEWPCIV